MWHAKSVYRIPLSFYRENGIEAIVFDLDNTLDPPFCKIASQRAKNLIGILRSSGIDVSIVSNNTQKRMKRYLDGVEIDGYVFDAKKPDGRKLTEYLTKRGLSVEKTVLIGDQLFTDKKVSERCKLNFVLTERLSRHELPWTYWNRMREMFVRKRMLRRGQLGERIEEKEA